MWDVEMCSSYWTNEKPSLSVLRAEICLAQEIDVSIPLDLFLFCSCACMHVCVKVQAKHVQIPEETLHAWGWSTDD